MAKARSGLGRGLGSLLNGGMGESLPQERSTVTERIVVSEPPAPSPAPAPVPAPAPEDPIQKEGFAPQPEDKAPQDEEEEPKALYSNEEDHVTIKGVVERVPVPKPTEEPKEELAPAEERSTDEIDIDLIIPNPDQPRTNFKKNELEELSESIKKNGLLQPILVRKVGDQYQIIAGERRWQACKLAGLKTVPVRVKEASDDDSIMLALVENIQRSDLNPIEEAYGYRRMMERGKMTQSEVAQAVSKGRSTIANALRLLELPEDAQQLLFEEKITAGHARAILSIPDKEGRRKLTDKLVEEKLSVRETEAIARLLSGKNDKDKQPRPPAPKSYKTVARALKETLDTNVKIKSSKGKNKIEIEFKDEADLERLFRIIAKE